MKFLIIFSLLTTSVFASGKMKHKKIRFKKEARRILKPIKKAFMKEIKVGMEKGPYEAIDSCHIKAPHLIEFDKSDKYEFGRTSHKIRNAQNTPKAWIKDILADYAKTNAKNPKAPQVFKVQEKNVYVEPIYIKPMCLVCHGEPHGSVKKRLSKLYPKDQATGFKVGDFRGLFWIKEK